MHEAITSGAWGEMLGMKSVHLSAEVAARILRRGRRVCHSESGAISYFAVGTCLGWKGADARARYAEKIERRIAICDRAESRSEAVDPILK
jgi:hypothetical protein